MIPSRLLRGLYRPGSLRTETGAVVFEIENRFSNVELLRLRSLAIDQVRVPPERVLLALEHAAPRRAADIVPVRPLRVRVGERLRVRAEGVAAAPGTHRVDLAFDTAPFGMLVFDVTDRSSEAPGGAFP